MRLLVTGASGQLGQALQEHASTHEVVAAFHRPPPVRETAPVLDLGELESIQPFVERVAPDWIIHTAAATDVDGCERDPGWARRINVDATRVLAGAAAGVEAKMAYVSTDYVFDGTQGKYREIDRPKPLSVYGRTKLQGEQAALHHVPDALICRTSVVFGPHKNNFILWVARSLAARQPIRIVDDQVVSATYTRDLAEQILALVEADASGIYHTAGATIATRLDLAKAVARAFGLDASPISPAKTQEMNWLAARPRDSSLDVTKVSKYAKPLSLDEALARLAREVEI